MKIYSEDLPYGFSLQMALHVFFSILKINFKDHFFQIFKKNLEFIFYFIIFFKKNCFTFLKSSEWIFKMIFEKKVFVSSEIRTCDPWLTSSALCLCATWCVMKVKWVNMEQFVYFDDDCKLPLSKYKLWKKTQCSISNILMACPSGPTICEILAIP